MAQAKEGIPDSAPVKKSRKKLFVLFGAGLLLVGGGAGTWYFLGRQAAPHEVEAQEPKAPVFVRLETFTVNLQPAEEERYLQTDIVLRVASDVQAEIFKQHMPEARSRLLVLLSSKRADELIPAAGKDQLMKEIVAAMRQPFLPNGKPQEVDGVFFTSFIIQ